MIDTGYLAFVFFCGVDYQAQTLSCTFGGKNRQQLFLVSFLPAG